MNVKHGALDQQAVRYGALRSVGWIGVLYLALVVLSLLLASQAQAAQPAWPPMSGNQQPQTTAPGWFPFAPPAPRQPAQSTGFPFPWMGSGSTGTATPQWNTFPQNTYTQPTMPFGGQSGFMPFNPMMGMGGMGSMGGMGGMGMMMAPMMGFMAPMMTNYAIASMNPTTMGNFFGMMSNPNGGMGMMPFGGFGFPGSGVGTPNYSYQNQAPGFPWAQAPTNPWSQPSGSYGRPSGNAPAVPSFFPFFNQGGSRQ